MPVDGSAVGTLCFVFINPSFLPSFLPSSRPASRASLKSVPAASSCPASIALAGSHAASSFSQQCTMPGLVLLLGVCAPTGGRVGALRACIVLARTEGVIFFRTVGTSSATLNAERDTPPPQTLNAGTDV